VRVLLPHFLSRFDYESIANMKSKHESDASSLDLEGVFDRFQKNVIKFELSKQYEYEEKS